MTLSRHLPLALLATALAGFPSCSTPQPHGGPGLGDDTASPTGTPFALPAGIALEGRMHGGSVCTTSPDEEIGSGFLVNGCMALVNNTDADVTVELPGGLIFISKNLDKQNGLLVEWVRVVIPARGRKLFGLNLYCLNLNRHVPFAEDDLEFGPVTDHPGLLELVDLVKPRSIDNFDESYAVQNAVWEVTDYEGLTDETRDELRRF